MSNMIGRRGLGEGEMILFCVAIILICSSILAYYGNQNSDSRQLIISMVFLCILVALLFGFMIYMMIKYK